MKKHITRQVRRGWGAIGLGLTVALLVGGCEPISSETVQGFMTDFARAALAAWIL